MTFETPVRCSICGATGGNSTMTADCQLGFICRDSQACTDRLYAKAQEPWDKAEGITGCSYAELNEREEEEPRDPPGWEEGFARNH